MRRGIDATLQGDVKMKINHDCIRDLLLYLESNLTLKSNGLNQHVKLSHIIDCEELKIYDPEEIYYSASKLVEGKFITVNDKNVAPRCFYISDITWNGHDYLNSNEILKYGVKLRKKLVICLMLHLK